MPGPMWDMHNRTTEEQARINRARINNGKISQVEDTASLNDAYDVSISLASSGVVHDAAQPDDGTVSTRQRGDGSDDGSVCGVART
tara:strand:+ start:219 stop:476 length:258 start_codon:yes stop_codon:yes gene_type:complete